MVQREICPTSLNVGNQEIFHQDSSAQSVELGSGKKATENDLERRGTVPYAAATIESEMFSGKKPGTSQTTRKLKKY